MSLVCFASLKGAPGVTATALAVAAAWSPRAGTRRSKASTNGDGDVRRKLLIEADPSGGALATRYRLAADPGLVSLAAAGRAGFDPDLIWRHTQELPGGLPVIAAPSIPAQAMAALDAIANGLGRHLAARPDVDALVDLGRLFPGSPGLALAMQSSALLVLSRPRPEDLQPAAAQLNALGPLPDHIGWVLIGDKPYGPSDVEQAFGHPVVAVVADDRRCVDSFEQGVEPKKLRRQPFFRSATALADTLASWLSAPPIAAGDLQQPESNPDEVVPDAGPADAPSAEVEEAEGAAAGGNREATAEADQLDGWVPTRSNWVER